MISKKAYFCKRCTLGVSAVLTAAALLSGCGAGAASETPAGAVAVTASIPASGAVKKPDKITMMVDGTLISVEKGRDVFEASWEELTGVDLEIIQPEHDIYYDEVTRAFDSGNLPDVVLLSSTYYTKYAAQDMLADISRYYEGSELQERIRAAGTEELIEGIRIHGKLFGITPTRGNGCMTYIKKSWLDRMGLKPPTDYAGYLDMLKKFSTGDPDGDGVNGNTYGVSAAGIINGEAPYVNYLPEFFQDAYPSFYEDESGVWADGFLDESMREALERLQSAYADGLIDPDILTNGTGDCRDKFYADEYGAFTYWAGTWANTLSNNLRDAELDSELIAAAPIAETGAYLERVAPVWCITSACKNPAGVYKYFLETMLDGGEVESLWTYAPDTDFGKNHIDRMLALVPIEDDPGAAAASAKAVAAAKTFNDNSRMADLPYSTDAFASYNDELMALKIELVGRVVTEGLSIDDAYAEYDERGGVYMSQAIVDSLNAE